MWLREWSRGRVEAQGSHKKTAGRGLHGLRRSSCDGACDFSCCVKSRAGIDYTPPFWGTAIARSSGDPPLSLRKDATNDSPQHRRRNELGRLGLDR